jgi:phosphatidylglycerol lysyltransferase
MLSTQRVAASDPAHDAQLRVLELLKAQGWNATSFQTLEPGFRYWFDGDAACVAYVDTGSAWVAAGAPIAPESRLSEVAQRFARTAGARGRRVAFFGTEQRFSALTDWPSLLIGEQPVWTPARFAERLPEKRSLREQLRRARAKGVRVRRVEASELGSQDAAMRIAIEELIARWRRTRPLAPMGFLVRVDPFVWTEERRIFVAETAGGLVGMVALAPVYARKGWLVESFVRSPAAPNGTMELLIDAAMRDTAASASEYLTLGLAPLAGDVDPWLRVARRAGRGLYDFAGLCAFKAKFGPETWSPIYVSYAPGGNAVVAIYDSLAAFSRGGLLRFGLETLVRGTVAKRMFPPSC